MKFKPTIKNNKQYNARAVADLIMGVIYIYVYEVTKCHDVVLNQTHTQLPAKSVHSSLKHVRCRPTVMEKGPARLMFFVSEAHIIHFFRTRFQPLPSTEGTQPSVENTKGSHKACNKKEKTAKAQLVSTTYIGMKLVHNTTIKSPSKLRNHA